MIGRQPLVVRSARKSILANATDDYARFPMTIRRLKIYTGSQGYLAVLFRRKTSCRYL